MGISNPRGSHFGLVTGSFYLAIALAGSLLPTWPGEAVPYFLGVLGLTGAWGIAAAQAVRELDGRRLTPLISRLVLVNTSVRDKVGLLDSTVRDSSTQGAAGLDTTSTDTFMAPGLAHFASALVTRQVIEIAPVSIVALVGLMVAPTLQADKWGFWHPVALWYSAPLPYLLGILFTMPMLLVARLYAGRAELEEQIQLSGAGEESQVPAGGSGREGGSATT